MDNPYIPNADNGTLPPFAGRTRAFEYLYARLTDPTQADACLVIGREGLGKTALLQHFSQFFDETFVAVYIPLNAISLADEDRWLRKLTDGAGSALAARNYTLSRLPEYEGGDVRTWITNSYFPELFHIIRRHRRLIFLLDDADALIDAVQNGRLPDDTFSYLHSLVEQFQPLGFVLTLDTQSEGDIARLSPLIGVENVFRLANLEKSDVQWLLTAPPNGCYSLTDEAVEAVYRATGGQPRLVERFGDHLFRRWEAEPDKTRLTQEDVKQVTPAVFKASEAELRAAWGETTRNERLALTAVSSLLYADPLTAVNPANIENWLVETDYPLDSTAIHAAIRGLEYREIVEQRADGIHLTSGLMQSWLLENGRLSETGEAAAKPNPRLMWAALAVGLALVIALVLLASGGGAPPADDSPEPTVTLVANP
jgi:hypothetical protein